MVLESLEICPVGPPRIVAPRHFEDPKKRSSGFNSLSSHHHLQLFLARLIRAIVPPSHPVQTPGAPRSRFLCPLSCRFDAFASLILRHATAVQQHKGQV